MLTLSFSRLNLRWNPFGEPSPEERAALAVVDLPDLRPGDPVQFIGPAGRGKTTHLLALAARHAGAIYEYIPEGRDRWTTQLPDGIVFRLDEAQRVKPALLERLFRRPLTLAFGTHEDLSPLAGRPIRTVRVDGIRPERLREVFARRIEWARRGPGPVPEVSAESVRRLIDRFGDDVRAMESVLYDSLQDLQEPGDVQV